MSKIGDLFVRLGLKKSEFDRGMDEAKAKTRGFGESMKEIGAKAKVAFAAIAVAAAAFVNEFVRHSQRFGDQWDQTMSRMKAAWNTFLTTLTNWDWEGFGRRISGAMEAAAQSTAMHDLEVEVRNSINIRKGQMEEELAMLQIQMRDTKLSYDERAAAAERYLAKVRPLYDQEIELREKIRNADLNEYLAKAGINQNANNRAAVETLLTEVAPNTALLNALSEYSKRNRGARKYKFTAEDEKLVNDFLATQDVSTGAALASLAEYYQGSNDKDAKKAADAITGLYSAQAAFNEETRRIQQTKNSAEAGAMRHYRVDRMTGIRHLSGPREGKELFEKTDMSAYSKKVFGMFTGQESSVKLRFVNHLAGAVIDRFGKDAMLMRDGPSHFLVTVEVAVSPQCFAWVVGFGTEAEIVGPEAVREQARDAARRIAGMYE